MSNGSEIAYSGENNFIRYLNILIPVCIVLSDRLSERYLPRVITFLIFNFNHFPIRNVKQMIYPRGAAGALTGRVQEVVKWGNDPIL